MSTNVNSIANNPEEVEGALLVGGAANAIDLHFGRGFAARHPELVGALLQFRSSHAIAEAITGLRESLRSDHPLMGCTLEGIAEALNRIAGAIEDKESVAGAITDGCETRRNGATVDGKPFFSKDTLFRGLELIAEAIRERE